MEEVCVLHQLLIGVRFLGLESAYACTKLSGRYKLSGVGGLGLFPYFGRFEFCFGKKCNVSLEFDF